MYSCKKQQAGASLIEIMIALALGIIIIMGATSSLVAITSSSRLQLGNNDMQQTADTALAYIGTRLRNALSTPCDKLSKLQTVGRLNFNTLVGEVGIPGKTTKEKISNDQKNTIEKLLKGRGIVVKSEKKTLAGKNVKSDSLIIASLSDRVAVNGDTGLDAPTVKLSGDFPTDNNTNDTLYAITNCDSMDIFRGTVNNKVLTPWNADPSKPTTTFRENYRSIESSMVSRVTLSEIKISNTGSLLNKNLLKSGSIALMEDVELLRILFAIDTQGDDGIADSYISAADMTALPASSRAKIISAELFLVVKNGYPDNSAVPANYSLKVPKTDLAGNQFKGDIFADKNVDTLKFSDRVMRRLFIRTVTFRNSASL